MAAFFRIPKYRKTFGGLLLVLVIACTLVAADYYYKNNFKYKELEERLVEIHAEMRADLPEQDWGKMEHFGLGMSIRNHYNLWDGDSDLNNLFKANGVFHPDTMSSIIMETFVRANKGVPFRLHKLILLQAEFYETMENKGDLHAVQLRMVEEFLIYESYREKIRRTTRSSGSH
jgi:hypothetical protein